MQIGISIGCYPSIQKGLFGNHDRVGFFKFEGIQRSSLTIQWLKFVACNLFSADGSTLRFWQNLLDPVQQLVADGCHLSRNTLGLIEAAGFTSLDVKNMRVKGLSLISPHILGTARTPEA